MGEVLIGGLIGIAGTVIGVLLKDFIDACHKKQALLKLLGPALEELGPLGTFFDDLKIIAPEIDLYSTLELISREKILHTKKLSEKIEYAYLFDGATWNRMANLISRMEHYHRTIKRMQSPQSEISQKMDQSQYKEDWIKGLKAIRASIKILINNLSQKHNELLGWNRKHWLEPLAEMVEDIKKLFRAFITSRIPAQTPQESQKKDEGHSKETPKE